MLDDKRIVKNILKERRVYMVWLFKSQTVRDAAFKKMRNLLDPVLYHNQVQECELYYGGSRVLNDMERLDMRYAVVHSEMGFSAIDLTIETHINLWFNKE